jgi:AAA domain
MRVTLEQLKELAGESKKEERKEKSTTDDRVDVSAYLDYYHKCVVKVKYDPSTDRDLYCLEECVFNTDHKPNEAYIGQERSTGKLSYRCFHNSCQGMGWQEAKYRISGNDSLKQFMESNNSGYREQRTEQEGTRTESGQQPGKMVFTPLEDLLNEPDIENRWLVENMFLLGGFGCIGGKPKGGKSTLGRQLAFCVARGDVFLGRKVTKGNVMYLELEEKRAEVKGHYQTMGASNEGVHVFTGAAPVDVLKQVTEAINIINPVLIVIDPLFRFTKVKESGEYAQMTAALDPLLRMARDYNATVIVIHHSTKAEREAIDSLLGSIAIAGTVDTIMLIKRYENYRTIQAIQRYGEDLPETTLEFDENTKTSTIGKSKYDEDVERVKKEISEYLDKQDEKTLFTEEQINAEVDGKTGLKRKAFRKLVEENQVHRHGKGIKRDPYKYSCFLVPTIYEEQGNEKGLQDVTPEEEKENPRFNFIQETRNYGNENPSYGNEYFAGHRPPSKQGIISILKDSTELYIGDAVIIRSPS